MEFAAWNGEIMRLAFLGKTIHLIVFFSGSPIGAQETRVFIARFGLTPCLTPVASPENNGVAFVGSLEPMAISRPPFVKIFKRDLYQRPKMPAHPVADFLGRRTGLTSAQ